MRVEVLKVVRDASIEVEKRPTIRQPEDIAAFARTFIGPADREHFLVLCLNARHALAAVHTVSIGTLNASMVHPREVFKAVLLANSAAIALVHNHPSGDPQPSEDDEVITKRLVEGGALLGIPVLDHVIVTDTAFVSMKQSGILSFR